MNIKEHIEAGHYPVDDKGRARVPMNGPGMQKAIIYTTEAFNSRFPIAGAADYEGRLLEWASDGTCSTPTGTFNLLPPPPRKVKVTRWLAPGTSRYPEATFVSRGTAEQYAMETDSCLIELTGEREVPWS